MKGKAQGGYEGEGKVRPRTNQYRISNMELTHISYTESLPGWMHSRMQLGDVSQEYWRTTRFLCGGGLVRPAHHKAHTPV